MKIAESRLAKMAEFISRLHPDADYWPKNPDITIGDILDASGNPGSVGLTEEQYDRWLDEIEAAGA